MVRATYVRSPCGCQCVRSGASLRWTVAQPVSAGSSGALETRHRMVRDSDESGEPGGTTQGGARGSAQGLPAPHDARGRRLGARTGRRAGRCLCPDRLFAVGCMPGRRPDPAAVHRLRGLLLRVRLPARCRKEAASPSTNVERGKRGTVIHEYRGLRKSARRRGQIRPIGSCHISRPNF